MDQNIYQVVGALVVECAWIMVCTFQIQLLYCKDHHLNLGMEQWDNGDNLADIDDVIRV